MIGKPRRFIDFFKSFRAREFSQVRTREDRLFLKVVKDMCFPMKLFYKVLSR